jgi:hypothetical protein
VNEAKSKDDKTALETAAGALSDAMQKIGESMANQTPAEGATPNTPTDETAPEGNVRDADVTGESDTK